MAGHGHGKGHGGGHGASTERAQRDEPMGRTEDELDPGLPDAAESGEDGARGHGRSEDSPGHLKRAAGEQSARDFAPGRTRRS